MQNFLLGCIVTMLTIFVFYFALTLLGKALEERDRKTYERGFNQGIQHKKIAFKNYT